MARTKSTARKSQPTPTLKQIINLNILQCLINQQSQQQQSQQEKDNNNNNNNNNNCNNSNSNNNYLYSYLNIIFSIINNNTNKEYINEYINYNNNQIESLYNQLSKYESIRDKERLVFEFIIINCGEILDYKFFYEYYEHYFIDEIDHQIKLNGGSNKLYTDQQFKEKEEKVFKLVEDRLGDDSIIRSIEMIAMDYYSIKAISIINQLGGKLNNNTFSKKYHSNLSSSLTYTRLMEFYNMVFNNRGLCISNSFWIKHSLKAISTGQVLKFNQMNSNEIIQLLDYLADNSIIRQHNYAFFQILLSLTQKEIKKMDIIVWRWLIIKCHQNEYKNLHLPFKIDSKELIDFIIEHYTVFKLIPQILNYNNNNNNNHHNSKSLKVDNSTAIKYFNNDNKPELNQNFKVTTLELAEYFNNKLTQLIEQHPLDYSIISNSGSSSGINKSQVYYYLFVQAIKNCDIETLKKLDSLDLKFEIYKVEDQFGVLDINKTILSNNKLKQFKLYNDQSSRIQLLNYLTTSGFKSFTTSSFYKLLGQLFYNIGSTVTPLQINQDRNIFFKKEDIQTIIESYKLFNDQDLVQNRSSVSNILQLNETLYLELIIDSVYKLNLPILELLLSSTTTASTSTSTLNINQELFITTLSKHSKSTSSILNRKTYRSNYQFETILNIIQLLLSKLPSASDQFPIHNIYTYLYKSILQSSNCTINKIKQVHSIYSTNSLDTIITNQDYFNFYYWCHNKSTKLSLLLNSLFKYDSAIKHLNPSASLLSPPNDLDLSKFTFTFISDSTFDYILEQFDRIKILNEYSLYYLNIGRRDLYIKALKEYLQLKRINNNNNSSFEDSYYDEDYNDDYQWGLKLKSYIIALDNDQDIQEILDLKLPTHYYQRLLDISIEGSNLNLFKYICTNFNRIEEESLELLHFDFIFKCKNSKILKYAIEHHLDQLKLYFGSNTFNKYSIGHWYLDIEFATLLMTHFPSIFSIGYNECITLAVTVYINQFKYYYQHGYLCNIVLDYKLLLKIDSNREIKILDIKFKSFSNLDDNNTMISDSIIKRYISN